MIDDITIQGKLFCKYRMEKWVKIEMEYDAWREYCHMAIQQGIITPATLSQNFFISREKAALKFRMMVLKGRLKRKYG